MGSNTIIRSVVSSRGLMAVAFIYGVALIAYISTQYDLGREWMYILSMIAGSLFFSGLALGLSYVANFNAAKISQVHFSADAYRSEIDEIVEAEFIEIENEVHESETELRDLALRDPVLALAKVRIDIEREVRRLFNQRFEVERHRPVPLLKMVVALEQEELIKPPVASAIRDILPAANRAIHGEQVDLQTAVGLADLAQDVIHILMSRNRVASAF